MTVPTLYEMDWRDLVCPLEKVKRWKHGFSVKCPMESMVCWTKDIDKGIRKELKIKRVMSTCARCRKDLKEFLKDE